MGHGERHLAQRFGLDRELVQIDQRIAHLARQGGLQVMTRHQSLGDQQLAQGHAAIALLALQGIFQLRLVDHAQGHQRFADAHHGHLALLLDGGQQLLGRDHLLGQQDVAQLLVAHLALHLHRLLDLRLRDCAGIHQDFANLAAHIKRVQHLAPHEQALHGAIVAHGGEQEDAELGFPVAHGLAFDLASRFELHPKSNAGAVPQHGRMGILPIRRPLGLDGVGEQQGAELAKAQGHGGARRRHLDVGHFFVRHEEAQAPFHDPAIEAFNFAGFVFGLLTGSRVGGKRRCGPEEHTTFAVDHRLILVRQIGRPGRARVELAQGTLPVQRRQW